MRISLDDDILRPNPLRDFKLDPVDQTTVSKLVDSIAEFDFWGGVTARKTPIKGVYDLIAGEHRRQAARNSGMTHAEIFVGDYDDETVLRMYATENATQRGNTSTAILGTIGSAIRMILRKELFAGASSNKNGDGRGKAHGKDGVGRPAIMALLDGIPGVTAGTVKTQLENLKTSGEYDRIVSEVLTEVEAAQAAAEAKAAAEAEAARLHAEQEERRRVAAEERAKAQAERAAKAAAEAEAAAKVKREAREQKDRERAEREAVKAQERAEREARRQAEEERKRAEQEAAAAQAREAAEAAAANTVTVAANKPKIVARREEAEAEKRPIEFDMGVATVFKDPTHVATFRRMVTENPQIQRILPPHLQLKLATALVEQQRQGMEKFIADGGNKRHASRLELTSAYIENNLYDLAAASSMIEHFASDAEKREAAEALRVAGWMKRFENYEEQIAGHTRSLASATDKLIELMQEVPQEGKVVSTKITRAIQVLDQIVTTLEKLGFHKKAVDGDYITIDHDPKLLNGEVIHVQ